MENSKPNTPILSIRLPWLELIKALALIWIFLNHTAEQLFGYPLIANPSADWPPLAERIAQLAPLNGFDLWDLPLNLLRYFGWLGDQGVQLFLIASGFGLTWGLLKRSSAVNLPLWDFYRRRAGRLYPLWWGAHMLFAAAWLVTGWGLSPMDGDFFLSLLSLRLTPELLYYFSPAWWYFGLLAQLYLLYPLLWAGLRRFGPWRLLLFTSAVAFLVRGAGAMFFEGYLDAWLRGAIFITRLPEFVFGISLAAWMHRAPARVDQRFKTKSTTLMAMLAYLLGLGLALTLPGMVVAPFILGVSAFIMLYAAATAVVSRLPERSLQPAIWVGQHSYSLYLMHHTWILLLVPMGLTGLPRTALGIGGTILISLLSAMFLEWGVSTTQNWWRSQLSKRGILRTLTRLALVGTALVMVLVGTELLIREFAPQEVLGWGERPSLMPDEQLGYRLAPSTTTRLRWQSYDYTVSSNALGFPAPDYPQEKAPGAYRIFVTGDAFSSAEGVDTSQAWPRLLETDLAAGSGRIVEVLNFAITGYGPNQYAAIIDTYAPQFIPDLIILQVFVNDFQDVLFSNQDFQHSIGFGLPSADSLYSTVRLVHLRRFMRLNLVEPVSERLRDKPRSLGYFLGNFLALERGHPEFEDTGRQAVADRFYQIKQIADGLGAQVVVLMVPAPVQICSSDELDYFPRVVDLSDTTLFDLDLPQKLMSEAAGSAGLEFIDLRPVLAADPECPYQARNMHWTKTGHRLVSGYLATWLDK